MRHVGVELVAGTVEICGHQVGATLPVLGSVGLKLNKLGQLGNPVRGVGLFGVTHPQRGLLEGNRRVLGIRADGTHDHGFWNLGDAACLDQIGAEHQVLDVKLSWGGHVCADTADAGSQVDHNVGCVIGNSSLCFDGVQKIDFGTWGSDHLKYAAPS